MTFTVINISLWTNRTNSVDQEQIKLLLEEQPNRGLHTLPICLHFFNISLPLSTVRLMCSNFRVNTMKFWVAINLGLYGKQKLSDLKLLHCASILVSLIKRFALTHM